MRPFPDLTPARFAGTPLHAGEGDDVVSLLVATTIAILDEGMCCHCTITTKTSLCTGGDTRYRLPSLDMLCDCRGWTQIV